MPSTTELQASCSLISIERCRICCWIGWSGSCATSTSASGWPALSSATATATKELQRRWRVARALDSIGEAERRLTAAMAGNGVAGTQAVESWVAPRRGEVERIRLAVNEIADSGLTLSKLTVAASLLGDLVRQ